jgi:hypothetical protein
VGVVFRCREKGWMDNYLMMDWIKVVWIQRPGFLLSKCGMFVLDIFKDALPKRLRKK